MFKKEKELWGKLPGTRREKIVKLLISPDFMFLVSMLMGAGQFWFGDPLKGLVFLIFSLVFLGLRILSGILSASKIMMEFLQVVLENKTLLLQVSRVGSVIVEQVLDRAKEQVDPDGDKA